MTSLLNIFTVLSGLISHIYVSACHDDYSSYGDNAAPAYLWKTKDGQSQLFLKTKTISSRFLVTSLKMPSSNMFCIYYNQLKFVISVIHCQDYLMKNVLIVALIVCDVFFHYQQPSESHQWTGKRNNKIQIHFGLMLQWSTKAWSNEQIWGICRAHSSRNNTDHLWFASLKIAQLSRD